jgi:hypothetical protein
MALAPLAIPIAPAALFLLETQRLLAVRLASAGAHLTSIRHFATRLRGLRRGPYLALLVNQQRPQLAVAVAGHDKLQLTARSGAVCRLPRCFVPWYDAHMR